eukprot:CAMPEP_0182910142 /NCGR_PEP_ID=MMETSP0034_2-20130328/36138_1 /TAXON_ID=156128 /ORGANISM="Nephroselmis pyriformis, Strain CCMP717" /LENGTH=148 /DNA_ID=CAMNT_0025046443 /DNA_START=15 /DNA_END=462 /DNA_ORIENTATION=-
MRHRSGYDRLGRGSSHRWAMLRTMVSQLIQHERIETTVTKAKELRRLADKMVTQAKAGPKDLNARREVKKVVRGDENIFKLFTELAPRYAEREGGYTRVLRGRRRIGDGAYMAFIEYVDRDGEFRKPKPPRKNLAASSSFAAQAFDAV